MKPFVEEILNDILQLDPDLQKVRKDLEHLIAELAKNKPETPFTKEFKNNLKTQIIGIINKQKILNEEKVWNRVSIFHSFKFWMVGFSSLATCLLVFALFQYINNSQQATAQITYIQNNLSSKKINPDSNMNIVLNNTKKKLPLNTPKQIEEDSIVNGGGASNRTDNVMMVAMPEPAEQDIGGANQSSKEYAITAKSADVSAPEFCETSKQFLNSYNFSDTSDSTAKTFISKNQIDKAVKDFTYNNQVYQAILDYGANSITISHIGTQNNSQIQTEIPNLNLFFKDNNFNISADYMTPIIEETDSIIEYYFARHNQQEGITVRIDKKTNIIFSVKNICIY